MYGMFLIGFSHVASSTFCTVQYTVQYCCGRQAADAERFHQIIHTASRRWSPTNTDNEPNHPPSKHLDENMPGKTPSSYDLDEVGIFLTAIGLESKVGAFRENAVDGDMLVSLQPEDFEELGLSGLQAKKLVRSVQFAASLANDEASSKGAADPSQLAALQKENANLKNENAALRAQLQEYTSPRPAPAPAPQQQHHHHQQPAGRPVIRGAAGGAARGTHVCRETTRTFGKWTELCSMSSC